MYTILHRFKQRLTVIAASTMALTVVGFSAAAVASAAASVYRPVAVPSAAAIPATASPPELRATYSTIDFPGARWTKATGVTRIGRLGRSIEVVGTYADGRGNIQDQHGFVLSGGHYTSLDFPGGEGTNANGINARGQVVGVYYNPNVQGWCSFLYSAGTYSPIFSHCWTNGLYGYYAQGINASGAIVGGYGAPDGHGTGFVSTNGTTQVGFTQPDSTCVLYGINNNPVPEIVGVFGKDGAIFKELNPNDGIRFDVPGASSTGAFGVNDSAQIVGAWSGIQGDYHGFLDDGGSFSKIDYPGATIGTQAYGIDNGSGLTAGYDIVGSYSGPGYHGFIATVSPIDGAAASAR